MIVLHNITKSFGATAVLDGASLTINKAARVALTGVSGCGKTTLLRLIAGLDVPDAGDIHLEGRLASTGKHIVLAPYARHIGYVFQSPALWPHMSVAQNIMFGLGGGGKGTALGDVMARTGISHLANRMPDTLSGGEQRLVAIARTLAPEPKILLLDEPLTNLDPETKAAMLPVIRSIVEDSDMTLVYVTHDITEAEVFCQRRLMLDAGNLVETPIASGEV